MNGAIDIDLDESGFVEVDPTGRYGRYNEILGKGSSKIVYRGFDEYEGIEVAWNQVKLSVFLQSPEDLERLYSEIHLLKTLKHTKIMKFYTSWVDTANRNINFVTEMFTSGTLRQYRQKHKRTNIRAIKHWCRQILEGLLYLHSHDPPVIHRDLKCDNIFINGNQGEVKIGDLGLAAILRKSHAARCVGTPEFMAPEVYEEEYNELVDIYSFGMCVLEMVTFEYPYSECNHAAQIYKKVISGKKPAALYKVKDPEVRRFVEKCLATVADRLSAWELLNDPFLQIDDYVCDLRPLNYDEIIGPLMRQPILRHDHHSANGLLVNYYSNYIDGVQEHDLDSRSVGYEMSEFNMFTDDQEDDHSENVGISIRGRMNEDDNIFLRLRIGDKEGRVRNIYFPFDIATDTALSVATEMVGELDITDQDVTEIAEMIDDEIASLVTDWKRGFGVDEKNLNDSCYHNCALDDSITGYLPSTGPEKSPQVTQCPKHVRFEEITTDQVEESEDRANDVDRAGPSQSEGAHYTDISDDHNNVGSRSAPTMNAPSLEDDYENEITRELRWLKAKYKRELKDRQLGLTTFAPTRSCETNGDSRKVYNYESSYSSCSPVHLVTANNFYSGAMHTHRATSLPVDATDF